MKKNLAQVESDSQDKIASLQTADIEIDQLKSDLSLIAKEYEYYKSRYEEVQQERDRFSGEVLDYKEEIFQWEKNYNEILVSQTSVNA